MWRVTFRFPGSSTEIRFLENPPSPGDRIEALRGRSWTVSTVKAEPKSLSYTVTCVPFVEPRRTIRDVVADLLEKARASHRKEDAAPRERREDAKRR
jgi:hypothetical protein